MTQKTRAAETYTRRLYRQQQKPSWWRRLWGDKPHAGSAQYAASRRTWGWATAPASPASRTRTSCITKTQRPWR